MAPQRHAIPPRSQSRCETTRGPSEEVRNQGEEAPHLPGAPHDTGAPGGTATPCALPGDTTGRAPDQCPRHRTREDGPPTGPGEATRDGIRGAPRAARGTERTEIPSTQCRPFLSPFAGTGNADLAGLGE